MDSSDFTPWIFTGIIVLLTVGLIVLIFAYGNGSSGTAKETTVPALTQEDWTHGPNDAKVSIIEYGDFQCPACAAYYPLFLELENYYKDKSVIFAFRNFPLYQVHKNAEISAKASEAAGLQGKYWEMHDKLYKDQISWGDAPQKKAMEQFDDYAKSLNLDLDKLHKDMESASVKNKIEKDVKSASDAFVDHTPTFFINLKQIKNPTSLDEFKKIIDDALAAS